LRNLDIHKGIAFYMPHLTQINNSTIGRFKMSSCLNSLRD